MNLFGRKHDAQAMKEKDQKEMLREWKNKLRGEERSIDRQLRSIDVEEAKVKRSAKEAVARGDQAVAKMFAKEILRARKAKTKLYTSKAQLHSLSNQMTLMQSTMRVAGNIGKSAEIMALMNNLIKVPEISKNMTELATEMSKAGIIEEMMSDALEAGEDDLSDAAEEEVDRVVMEITGEGLSKIGAVPVSKRPAKQQEEEEEEDTAEIQRRLQALKE
eukprot:c13799_g1_i1.p1 GENE.c13799_g1_i1~~c13799_g1_i1.p1  ORF type:complete len:229 (+),score=103.82 c13799_g1_i1:34-687(+)